MKQLLTGFFLVIFSLAYAQEKQDINLNKKWLVGGNAKLFVEKIGNQTGRLIVEFDPQAGYFFTPSFAAGLRLPVSFTSDAFRVALNPFVRYYIPTQSYIKPFVEINGGHSWRMIYDTKTSEYDDLEQCWIFGGQAGAAFFFNNRVSIDFYFYYSGQDCKVDYDGQVRESPFYQNFGIGGGFQIYL